MGELLLQLRKDNMKAMKEHDTLTKGVLSLVISAIAREFYSCNLIR